MEPSVVEYWWKENNVGAFGLYKSDKTMVGCPSISVLGTSQSTSQMCGDGLVTVDRFRQGRAGTLNSLEQTLRLCICLPSHGASFTITALFTVMVYYTALLLTIELILQQIKWQQAYDLWYPLVLSCSPLPCSSWLDETMKWHLKTQLWHQMSVMLVDSRQNLSGCSICTESLSPMCGIICKQDSRSWNKRVEMGLASLTII